MGDGSKYQKDEDSVHKIYNHRQILLSVLNVGDLSVYSHLQFVRQTLYILHDPPLQGLVTPTNLRFQDRNFILIVFVRAKNRELDGSQWSSFVAYWPSNCGH